MTENTLLREAQLGIETQAFITSDLGKYLIARADEELMAGYEGFLTLKPSDTDTLLQLQSQCLRAIGFKSWLLSAISIGDYAERELTDE
jgi:hypothetical protein